MTHGFLDPSVFPEKYFLCQVGKEAWLVFGCISLLTVGTLLLTVWVFLEWGHQNQHRNSKIWAHSTKNMVSRIFFVISKMFLPNMPDHLFSPHFLCEGDMFLRK